MNRNSYNSIATAWDAARTTCSGLEQQFLDTFLADIVAPALILDLGCGTGRPIGEYILSRGHHLIGVDQASMLLQLARSRFPQAHWIEARIEDVTLSESFAGIVCWDALFHIERSAHDTILRKMAAFLQPNGMIMVTVGGSDHPAFTDTMFDQPFFYDSHPPATVIAILEQIGFAIVRAEFLDLPTTGRDKGRYAIVARYTPARAE